MRALSIGGLLAAVDGPKKLSGVCLKFLQLLLVEVLSEESFFKALAFHPILDQFVSCGKQRPSSLLLKFRQLHLSFAQPRSGHVLKKQ